MKKMDEKNIKQKNEQKRGKNPQNKIKNKVVTARLRCNGMKDGLNKSS